MPSIAWGSEFLAALTALESGSCVAQMGRFLLVGPLVRPIWCWMAKRKTHLFGSFSITSMISGRSLPGCILDVENMGQLRTQHVSLFGRSFA